MESDYQSWGRQERKSKSMSRSQQWFQTQTRQQEERMKVKLTCQFICKYGIKCLIVQNIQGLLALRNIAGKALNDNNYKGRDFMDPQSTLNQRKDFRFNSQTKQQGSGGSSMKPKKRSLTFNQLLAKYGYIEDESVTQKVRVRPWHVKKPKNWDESSNSSDE